MLKKSALDAQDAAGRPEHDGPAPAQAAPAEPPGAPAERRSGRDRRRLELSPPKGIERRKGMEPRRPEVREIELSASEWAQLEAEVLPPSKAAQPPDKP